MKKIKAISLLLALFLSCVTLGCGNEKKTSENKKETIQKEEMADKDGVEEEKEQKENLENEDSETESVVEEVKKQKISILASYDMADTNKSREISVMKQLLEEKEYIVEVYNEAKTDQNQQILDSLEQETDAMIIIPEDPYALTESLAKAKEMGVPVFSYENLIMNTDAVNYYITFDTREMGNMMANEIVKAKELEKAKENNLSYTIEFLMGKPEDSRELFFFNGIMEVLQPYFEEGILQCKSQKLTFDQTCIMDSKEMVATKEFEKTLNDYYEEGQAPDIICLASDTYINGIFEALKEHKVIEGENWPYIAGRGCQSDTVKKIAEEQIAFSLFADERALAEKCVELVDGYLKGEDLEVKDYHQYDNGVKIIGTNSAEVKLIDKDNYQLLVDNGYYLPEEIS